MNNKGFVLSKSMHYTVILPWRDTLSGTGIVIETNGKWSCNCPQWKRYLEPEGKDCEHIKVAKSEQRGGETDNES